VLPDGAEARDDAPVHLLDGVAPGRVVSVNVAVVSTAAWTGRMRRSGMDKRPVPGPVLIGPSGVDGDTVCDTKFHGGPHQAVYAYAAEDVAHWAAELGRPISPGGMGENLTLAGVDCSGAVVGERWQVGDAVLVVTGPRVPCRVFAGFHQVPDLVARFFAAGRPGSYLGVRRPAAVRAGDPVTVLDRPAHGVTVADVIAVLGGRRALLARVATARADLGPRWRNWLDGVLGGARS
jgi:MOSC domain-containing protein YiiM